MKNFSQFDKIRSLSNVISTQLSKTKELKTTRIAGLWQVELYKKEKMKCLLFQGNSKETIAYLCGIYDSLLRIKRI